jgi:hypothetical protein
MAGVLCWKELDQRPETQLRFLNILMIIICLLLGWTSRTALGSSGSLSPGRQTTHPPGKNKIRVAKPNYIKRRRVINGTVSDPDHYLFIWVVWCETGLKLRSFLYIFWAGLSVLAIPSLMSTILYFFWEMYLWIRTQRAAVASVRDTVPTLPPISLKDHFKHLINVHFWSVLAFLPMQCCNSSGFYSSIVLDSEI